MALTKPKQSVDHYEFAEGPVLEIFGQLSMRTFSHHVMYGSTYHRYGRRGKARSSTSTRLGEI